MRATGAAIKPAALKAWIDEEAVNGTVDRETLWLFRTGYITTVDGEAYTVTDNGWAALDQYMIEMEEASRREEAANGESSPDEPVLPAKEEMPDTLIIMGAGAIKDEAQRMTMRAFPNTAPSFRHKK
jgi:hypothetical protein